MDATMEAPRTERMLRMGLDFSTTELNANRASGMTSTQRAKLQQHRLRLRLITVALWLGFLLLPAVASLFLHLNMGRAWAVLLAMVVGQLALACTALRLAKHLEAVGDDLRLGMVVTAAGPVFLVIRRWGSFTRNLVRIEDQEFSVSAKVLLSFKNAERYYIHYAPHSLVILSAESVAHSLKGDR
ncbi:MAG: hypothetical protein K8L99_28575 [Anaerolineae bacterium]|nr:hypothetical protein [Anaerolineae bacterium]